MLHGQAFRTSNKHATHNAPRLGFRTPNKHVTHYGPRSGFLYRYQTRYSLCSTVRLSVPLTNTLPTMVHGQAFRTPNKHVTHYGPRSGFRTPIKHFTHYAPWSGFLYPYQTRYSLCSTVRLSVPLTNMLLTMVHGQAVCTT